MLAVNVTGTFLCCAGGVEPYAPGGSIVNPRLRDGVHGLLRLRAHVASKGAVVSMSRALARELGLATSGSTRSPRASRRRRQGERAGLGGDVRRAARRSAGACLDLGTIIFLPSPDSAFVSGQAILVNGGRQRDGPAGLETVRRVRGTVAAMTARSAIGVERLDDRLVLAWDDGQRSTFHHLWLRDNCLCPALPSSSVPERLVDTTSIPDDIAGRRRALRRRRAAHPLGGRGPSLDVPAALAGPARIRRRASPRRRRARVLWTDGPPDPYPTWPTPR